MAVQIAHRHFSAAEFHLMGEAGVFSEEDRVELIEGVVVEMTPIGSRHAACVNRLMKLLERAAGDFAVVSIQNPLHVDDFSEPEPDVAVLRNREDFYASGHPGPQDCHLLVEVADASLEYDRRVKIPLYARAGIPVVWIVDLSSETVEVFAQPTQGRYKSRRRSARGSIVEAATLPGVRISVDTILG